MKPLVSVIIPVYNAEKYLNRCVESVLNQTYHNLEIILVNDGSTDQSRKICESYLIQDKRVKFFNQENGGSSLARNKGLDNANGEYITFVDSDDHIKNDMYKQMVELSLDHNLDIVEVERNAKSEEVFFDNSFVIEDPTTAFERIIQTTSFQVWKRLFRKVLIEEMRFIPHIIHQDAYFVVDAINKVSKIGFLNSPLYFYNRESIGIVRSKYTIKKRDDGIRVLEYIKNNIPNNDRLKKVMQDHIVSYYSDHYFKLSQNTSIDKDGAFREKLKKEIRSAANWSNIGPYSALIIFLPTWVLTFLFQLRNKIKNK